MGHSSCRMGAAGGTLHARRPTGLHSILITMERSSARSLTARGSWGNALPGLQLGGTASSRIDDLPDSLPGDLWQSVCRQDAVDFLFYVG